jgi:molecular chaperone HtpG
MQYLERVGPDYFAKACELRETAERWLEYTTDSFAHYTQHTARHSDEIVEQMSKLLFEGDDPDRPVVRLSAAEAYILVAAAYLHDAGMVVSDAEKGRILGSSEWERWLGAEHAAADRWAEIEVLRRAASSTSDAAKHLAADRQTRFLIAEFVRRTHHHRAAELLREHQGKFGRFAYDDPLLERAVVQVCLGHGLTERELEDDERFPDQCDIRGDKVNVRFLAIMLRLGDLLDLRWDRACPLLLSAASPLPPDSIAHWTQHQRITLRETSPTLIRLVAECESQEEHRFLHDWCDWIQAEVTFARGAMARCRRHTEWQPPTALVGDPHSMVIRPAQSATYVPSNWRLELDEDAVLERLIFDVHSQPLSFVRELLQNSLDASRCKLYKDLRAASIEPPSSPSKAPPEWLNRYAVQVSVESTHRFNELSQASEERQVIVVEDRGMGMDRDIIEQYFLQVGRSYYTTDEFKRSFEFAPTSRFGVGFLSVFASSDEVIVETLRDGQAPEDSLRLTLTGPRSYLLTERADRTTSGTRIEVLLREPLDPGDLTELVAGWCRRVEFPVEVSDFGDSTQVARETPSDFVYEEPDLTTSGGTMGVRSFDIDRPGIEGEIYVFFRRLDEGKESWADRAWAEYRYSELHPTAARPRVPPTIRCFHGIATSPYPVPEAEPFATRLDYRRPLESVPLSREVMPRRRPGRRDREVHSRLVELLEQHLSETSLATGADAWRYKQRLMSILDLEGDFWLNQPGTVPAVLDGEEASLSLSDFAGVGTVTVALRGNLPFDTAAETPTGLWLAGSTLQALSDRARRVIFSGRHLLEVRLEDDVVAEWGRGTDGSLRLTSGSQAADVANVTGAGADFIGFPLHKTFNSTYRHAVLNAHHPFVQWLVGLHEACASGVAEVNQAQLDVVLSLLSSPIWYHGLDLHRLQQYLERWNQLDLPDPLKAPEVSAGSFQRVGDHGLTVAEDEI